MEKKGDIKVYALSSVNEFHVWIQALFHVCIFYVLHVLLRM